MPGQRDRLTIRPVSPDIIQALVRVLEVKDLSTAAHTWRVVLYTRALAEAAGVDRDTIERLTYAAALHDIGKIDVPEAILQKPGPLTDEEFAVMKQHPVLGHERLVRMQETDPIMLDLVRHHHERWDGLGYPDRLAGERTPVAARYFAVIDSFDALTSHRPYRHDVGPDAAERAIAEMERGIGTRYCPGSVEMFVDLYRTGMLTWILEYFNDKADVPEYKELGDVNAVMKRSRAL